MKIYKIVLAFLLSLSQVNLFAQKMAIETEDYSNNKVEMADIMRSEGKIYVLLAIILIIFAGFIFYLFKTEQKLKKFEKEHEIID